MNRLFFISDHVGIPKRPLNDNCLFGIREDLIRASKRSEVTLMVCADYSKVFDTVEFKIVLMKVHNLRFSREFLL